MFFLKKLATSLILPPGFFIVIFLMIFILVKKYKLLRFISIFMAFFIYSISIEPVKDFLITPLEKPYSQPLELKGDVIVILGGGVYNSGSLKEDTVNRLLEGYMLYKKIKTPIILSGGNIEGKTGEANIMARILKELGVNEKFIIEENTSRDTSENAKYVAKICKKKDFRKIILVTSGYHMKRAVIFFKDKGFEVVPYPVDFKRDGNYTVYSFLPKFSSFVNSTKAIREYLALLILLI